MIALLRTEIRKLGGSLALWLALAAPGLPALLVLLGTVTGKRAPAWSSVYNSFSLPIWAMFLLPMTVAAFTALVGGIEHRARGWDHLLSLPIQRWQLFAAKLVVVAGAVVLMTLLMLAFATIAAAIGGLMRGQMPLGTIPWAMVVRTVSLMLAASAALGVIQLWVALRFPNFVVPLIVGIGGTLTSLAVAITRTTKADYFPWLLPVKALRPEHAASFATIGGVAGVLLAMAMVASLSRHSFR